MDANIVLNWLNNNEMVANPKKFQLMCLARNKCIEKEMSFVGKAIKSSSTVELLGITLDKNLNFKSHIENICCKANNKITALFRILSFFTLEQAKVLAEAYISSNFRYCPLIWMFCGKCSNNLIMKTNYWWLTAIYNTLTKTYRNLLCINGKIDIRTQKIQILMTEIYKCLNKISPTFTWDYYHQRSNHYNLRRYHLFDLNKCKTKTYEINTAVFKGAVIRNNHPNHVKVAKSLTEFKTLVREWTSFYVIPVSVPKLFYTFFP